MFEINIPKIIHLTYKQKDTIPDVWKDTIKVWQQKHPDWQVWFWDDNDNRKLIETKYSFFLPVYDSYEYGIQRADAVRYFILYTYGGLYSDLDIQPTKSFNRLFKVRKDIEVYLIKSSNISSYTTNCLMASKPKSKFWKHVFNELISSYYDPSWYWIGKHFKVMNTTGPIMLNRAFENYKNKSIINFLPSDLLYPSKCNVCSRKPCKTVSSYTKILDGCSWINFDTKFFNFFVCNHDYIIALLMSIILLLCRNIYFNYFI
jgi:mannosyltransferase OCH1-like enzyme